MTNGPLSQEQLEQIGRETRHAAAKTLEHYIKRALVAFLLVIAASGFSLYASYRALHQHTNSRVEKAQLTSCARLNTVRAQTNITNEGIVNILIPAANRERMLAKVDKAKGAHIRSAKAYERVFNRLTVIPLTNCRLATEHPFTYRFPKPIGTQNPEAKAVLTDSHNLLGR